MHGATIKKKIQNYSFNFIVMKLFVFISLPIFYRLLLGE